MRVSRQIGIGLMLIGCALSATSQDGAQPASRPPPPPGTFASYVAIAVDTCPLTLDNSLLKLQMGRTDAATSVAEVRNCVTKSAASVESAYAERVAPKRSELAQDCRAALLELRAAVAAHYENFISPTEPPTAGLRRVQSEARALKTQSTKAKMVCE